MSLSQKDLCLDRPFLINGSELVACVVYEAIKCKSYPTLPRKIDIIVKKVTELYLKEFQKFSSDFYFKEFTTYDALFVWLNKHVMSIKEIQELNLSQAEFDAGIAVDDPNRAKYVCLSPYSPPLPEDDFIDLDAFARNLTRDLIRSCIEINFSTFSSNRGWRLQSKTCVGCAYDTKEDCTNPEDCVKTTDGYYTGYTPDFYFKEFTTTKPGEKKNAKTEDNSC